jgi:hypothetical protein
MPQASPRADPKDGTTRAETGQSVQSGQVKCDPIGQKWCLLVDLLPGRYLVYMFPGGAMSGLVASPLIKSVLLEINFKEFDSR